MEAISDPRIATEAMAAGLRETTWPARLQRLKPGPLTGGNGAAIWVDAAHNPGGAAALAEAISSARPDGGDKVALVMAIQGVKDIEAVLTELAPAVDEIIACPLPDSGGQEGGPGADPHSVASIAAALGANVSTAADFMEGVELARHRGADRIFIAGSVYLCGAALKANGEHVE
jgi:dihydrofolate synthase/folylpolyglutamate synthase